MVQTEVEKAGHIIRCREGAIVAAEGEKCRGERALKKKVLINDERTLNVYENKQKDDNLSAVKGEIFAKLYAMAMTFCTKANVFCRIPRLFCHYPSAGGMNLSLQNIETRDCGPVSQVRALPLCRIDGAAVSPASWNFSHG